jgi:hypothetical protein
MSVEVILLHTEPKVIVIKYNLRFFNKNNLVKLLRAHGGCLGTRRR